MAGKEAQRHHFIPQFLLRNFAGQDGQLWFWRHDFDSGDVKKIGPKNLFVEKDLYAVINDNGEKDITLEKRFALQEELMADFLRQLLPAVQAGSKIRLTEAAWKLCHLFFYFLIKRSPGYIKALLRETDLQDQWAEQIAGLKEAELSAGRTDGHEELEARLGRNAVIYAQSEMPSDEVLAAFELLGLVIYRGPPNGTPLVIGDVPGTAAAFMDINDSASGKLVFYPVAPDVALGYVQAKGRVDMIDLTEEQIRKMNDATAARSWIIAGSSKDILASLSSTARYDGPITLADQHNWNGA